MLPQVTIIRSEHFSAAHRLHSPHLSDAENKDIFGKCNSKNGHGHNYILEAHVTGPVDPKTGMVMNLVDLKKIIKDTVVDVLDHTHIDMDVPAFKTMPSTAENIAIWAYEAIKTKLPSDLSLKIRLHETASNIVEYQGL